MTFPEDLPALSSSRRDFLKSSAAVAAAAGAGIALPAQAGAAQATPDLLQQLEQRAAHHGAVVDVLEEGRLDVLHAYDIDRSVEPNNRHLGRAKNVVTNQM